MNGLLVVDKPEGPTSHDVVALARRMLGEKRIGHTGTLDPLATGVLPLACGRATRLVRFLAGADKVYDATILFGVTTDTLDVTGAETGRSSRVPTHAALADALGALTGDSLQTPPAYSAKKVAGRRAYALARRDEPVALKPVPVRVTSLDLLGFSGERCHIRLTCSSGFYVRSLARDIGERCGTGACLEALRRTRSGDFTIEEAVPLDTLEGAADVAVLLIPMERLLLDLPVATVTSEGLSRVSHGQEVRPSDLVGGASPSGDRVRLLDASGALLAVATPRQGSDFLHPEVVLI